MTHRKIAVALVCSTLLGAQGLAAHGAPDDEDVIPKHSPPPKIEVTKQSVQRAIDKGIDFLLTTQKKDGSWGTPAPTFICDVWSPVPSCFQTYEVAVSSMAISALLEVGEGREDVANSIEKGVKYLLANHPVKRVEPGHLYNNWAHCYALEAFARLMAHEEDEERRAIYHQAAEIEIERLERYEYVDGGWGYYDFNLQSARPSTGSTSFMTATALVALRMAADQGVEVDQKLIDRAMVIMKGSRGIDDSFAYSYSSLLRPHNPLSPGVSHKKGSLARTPACLLCMDMWGEPIETENFKGALDDLEDKGHFLLIARKYPFPHETWYQNSGYFCFYGYYYAAQVAETRLSEEDRHVANAQMASHLLPLQEPDGSWWDYQLFGYHKPYGTAYVLMTLIRCLDLD